jgi:hypothetical protein
VASLIPERQHTPSVLIECADQALYQAKRAGRNRVEVYRNRHLDEPLGSHEDAWVKRLAQLPFVADLTVEPAQLANAGLLGAAHQAWSALS